MSLDDIINKNKTKTAPKESTGERKPRASGHDDRKGARAGARPVRARGRGGEDRAPGLLRVVVKGSGVQKGGGMRSSRPAVRACAGNELQVDRRRRPQATQRSAAPSTVLTGRPQGQASGRPRSTRRQRKVAARPLRRL